MKERESSQVILLKMKSVIPTLSFEPGKKVLCSFFMHLESDLYWGGLVTEMR